MRLITKSAFRRENNNLLVPSVANVPSDSLASHTPTTSTTPPPPVDFIRSLRQSQVTLKEIRNVIRRMLIPSPSFPSPSPSSWWRDEVDIADTFLCDGDDEDVLLCEGDAIIADFSEDEEEEEEEEEGGGNTNTASINTTSNEISGVEESRRRRRGDYAFDLSKEKIRMLIVTGSLTMLPSSRNKGESGVKADEKGVGETSVVDDDEDVEEEPKGILINTDDSPNLILVGKDLTVPNLYTSGMLLVMGNLTVQNALIGDYNDYSAKIGGNVSARFFYPEEHDFEFNTTRKKKTDQPPHPTQQKQDHSPEKEETSAVAPPSPLPLHPQTIVVGGDGNATVSFTNAFSRRYQTSSTAEQLAAGAGGGGAFFSFLSNKAARDLLCDEVLGEKASDECIADQTQQAKRLLLLASLKEKRARVVGESSAAEEALGGDDTVNAADTANDDEDGDDDAVAHKVIYFEYILSNEIVKRLSKGLSIYRK